MATCNSTLPDCAYRAGKSVRSAAPTVGDLVSQVQPVWPLAQMVIV